MTTLICGAHGPLGLACVRSVLSSGEPVAACVQAPHRTPPALQDLRDEYPSLLTITAWQHGALPTLPSMHRAIIAELPIPPVQSDEADDAAAAIRALDAQSLLNDARTVLVPTLHAIQLVTAVRPARVLIQGSWLGSIEERVRGGSYAPGVAYAAQLMLVRTAAFDLQRAGIATVIGNAGRYKLDLAGPDFHADVDQVARGLLAVLDACDGKQEPEFRDWRGTIRRW
jgi:NAD(P)-dependent dehydrogenase (short-subunit alcohol dehydrogenase family)